MNNQGILVIKRLYFDPFMDFLNREIISYGISEHPSTQSIMGALNNAIKITSDCKYRRTFHSDQGWAYQMNSYLKTLKEHKIFQSMSCKGNFHYNSIMENFFGILKQEMYYGVIYKGFDDQKLLLRLILSITTNNESKKNYAG